MKIQKLRRNSVAVRCGTLLLAASVAVSAAWCMQSKESGHVYAASFHDISGHWAERYIEKAIDYGFVNGYEDGTFKPNAPITRAEFTTMFNAALENKSTADIDFADVTEDDWFYDDISKGGSSILYYRIQRYGICTGKKYNPAGSGSHDLPDRAFRRRKRDS